MKDHLSAVTHQNIIAIAKIIESEKTKNGIKAVPPPEFERYLMPDEAQQEMESAIRLAARLPVMMGIEPLPNDIHSERSPLLWGQSSLKYCLRQFFAPSQQKYSTKLKLQPLYTARNLVRVAGIRIVWSDNLADHLRLINGNQRVHIFNHASSLKWQRDIGSCSVKLGIGE